ncbi:MAG: tRNA (adenosine(37)-N6)-threonylcarbamoyltransferase complex dimerization subunit type 1 TsaB [Leptolinea sp.]|jgi:tRNA threonylcarbamoyladenosine biosynthesis protein TsaB|nr:tRNA (adenosine(37)-N6)-threonylcarbamoyltransferase complex dimerization subunit type 1 TsaB [Leptolinea sp.]
MLLAVDTSTQTLGLALYDGSRVPAESIWQSRARHTVELAPAVDRMLKQTGLTPVDLTGLVVATGPGSFTSLRVGIAFIKGLALGLKIPTAGVPSLDMLTAAYPPAEQPLAAVLPAGRNRLAVCWYRYEEQGWKFTGEMKVQTAQDLTDEIHQPSIICGELSADERQTLARKWKNIHLATPAQGSRRPAMLAELGWKRLEFGQADDPISLAPIYLHINEVIPS